jgi:hypothetical protein
MTLVLRFRDASDASGQDLVIHVPENRGSTNTFLWEQLRQALGQQANGKWLRIFAGESLLASSASNICAAATSSHWATQHTPCLDVHSIGRRSRASGVRPFSHSSGSERCSFYLHAVGLPTACTFLRAIIPPSPSSRPAEFTTPCTGLGRCHPCRGSKCSRQQLPATGVCHVAACDSRPDLWTCATHHSPPVLPALKWGLGEGFSPVFKLQ